VNTTRDQTSPHNGDTRESPPTAPAETQHQNTTTETARSQRRHQQDRTKTPPGETVAGHEEDPRQNSRKTTEPNITRKARVKVKRRALMQLVDVGQIKIN